MVYHSKAKQAGIPPPLDNADTTEITLHTEEALLNAAHNEEIAKQSQAETTVIHHLSDQYRKQMSANMSSHIVSSNSIVCA